ncbi:MAG TPA: hypothetical protein VM100_07600 [Longimicrobiales bacterium]|nr:hypothetical protein [Longimicrobiales bacterium]
MNNKEAILTQTVEMLELMNQSLANLRRECLPSQPRKFAILSEGPLEEIRRLQIEIERLTAELMASPV